MLMVRETRFDAVIDDNTRRRPAENRLWYIMTGLQCRTGEVFAALGVQSRFNEETHECAGK